MAEKPDLGDAEQAKAVAQKAATRAKRIQNGLAAVLANQDSRLWLFSLLEDAQPFSDPMTGNSHTFYKCGQQAWARRLIAEMLENHLDAYTKMMRENNPG